jgi:hypothetical protein
VVGLQACTTTPGVFFFFLILGFSSNFSDNGKAYFFQPFFFFLVGLQFEFRDSHLAKQALYRLSCTSSPFCSGYFGGGGCLLNYLPGLASNLDPPNLNLPSS